MTASMIHLALAAALLSPGNAWAQHQHQHQAPPPAQKPAEDHSAHGQKPAGQPKEPLPPITDADRAAAFSQDLEGHTVHDQQWHYFVLFDQLEWQSTSGGARLENTSWFGGDVDRLWLRVDAESDDGRLEGASAHALWGRSFSRWWDVVAGVRQDIRPGDPQTWWAFGVQGLAPYWFEVEATGYVGADFRTQLRVEVEYDLLLTNRLILQPLVETTINGKGDPGRGMGAGLSALETGLRLRYEIRRELAPYVGVTWHRSFFGTADRARAAGEEAGNARLAIGLRTWF
jgi:copper resistance protein B